MSEKKPSRKTQTSSRAGSGPMDVDLLESLVKLMQANDLNTIELRDGERRVILKRGASQQIITQHVQPAMISTAANGSAAHPASPAPATPADENAGLTPIKSPMVGTFYAASSPDAKPFVSVGTAISEETDVCVIEAMKVFNTVKAECAGTIAKIMVSNGQAVEFGQTLFLVKP